MKIPPKTKAPEWEKKINNTKPGKSNYFAQHRFTWRKRSKQLCFLINWKKNRSSFWKNVAPEHQAVKLADGGHVRKCSKLSHSPGAAGLVDAAPDIDNCANRLKQQPHKILVMPYKIIFLLGFHKLIE
jgi:hypothetical protein